MNERITVVEPQALIQAHVERMLRDLGYEVVHEDDAPDLALVAFGTSDSSYEERVKSWLEDDAVPVIASVYQAETLVEVASSDAVFASLVRPFNRARLSAAIHEAGGTSSVNEAEIAVATASGTFVVDDEQVQVVATEAEAVLPDTEGLVEKPMLSFGPDSGMIKTFAPALVRRGGAHRVVCRAARHDPRRARTQ